MLQPSFSLEISISTNSQNMSILQTSKAGSPNLNPTKIRFAAVTSATLIGTKEAVQSE